MYIENIKKNLSDQLKKLRKERGLKQENVVQQLGELNISLRTYKSYENGKEKYFPDLEKVMLLAEFFHVSVDFLLYKREAIDENSFTWEDNLKRLAGLLYCMVLIQAKDEKSGRYFFYSFDKETEIYLDQLNSSLKETNFNFTEKGKPIFTSVKIFEKIPKSIKEDKTQLSPSHDRIVRIAKEIGIDDIENQIKKTTKIMKGKIIS